MFFFKRVKGKKSPVASSSSHETLATTLPKSKKKIIKQYQSLAKMTPEQQLHNLMQQYGYDGHTLVQLENKTWALGYED
ncbi:hypothetical protein BGW42_006280 [Actinomortierella wolfii]|nr:hypothetical protein BGW42_006280 [Actinomortierella wolfii]